MFHLDFILLCNLYIEAVIRETRKLKKKYKTFIYATSMFVIQLGKTCFILSDAIIKLSF